MKFKDIVIDVGGVQLYVTSATINESIGFDAVQSLGSMTTKGSVASSRPEGSIDLSFYIDGSGSANKSVMDMISGNSVTIKIDKYGTSGAWMQKYSMSAQPNELITANSTFAFYGNVETDLTPATHTLSETTFMHGGTSVPSVGMFNNNLYSFSYDLSRDTSPEYMLGQTTDADVVVGGNVSCSVSIEGSGIGSVIEAPCSDGVDISFSMRNLCETGITLISQEGMKVTSSSLELSPDRDLVGSVSLIKYL